MSTWRQRYPHTHVLTQRQGLGRGRIIYFSQSLRLGKPRSETQFLVRTLCLACSWYFLTWGGGVLSSSYKTLRAPLSWTCPILESAKGPTSSQSHTGGLRLPCVNWGRHKHPVHQAIATSIPHHSGVSSPAVIILQHTSYIYGSIVSLLRHNSHATYLCIQINHF